MKASIIICCYNSADILEAALRGAASQTLPSHEYEIIVVDNASTDETALVATAFADTALVTIKLVSEPKPGLLFARCRGVMAAQGDYVCFVDDDNILDPNYLFIACSLFSAYPKIGYLGGRSVLPTGAITPHWLSEQMMPCYAVGRQRQSNGILVFPHLALFGAGLCARRAPLKTVLDDSDKFFCQGRTGDKQLSGEDTEICYRLALAGWQGYYDDRLLLTHAIRARRFTKQSLIRMFQGFGLTVPYMHRLESQIMKTHRHAAAANEAGPDIQQPVSYVQQGSIIKKVKAKIKRHLLHDGNDNHRLLFYLILFLMSFPHCWHLAGRLKFELYRYAILSALKMKFSRNTANNG
jgi:glycosyltransferase involved in cell wall biosynthesis